MFVDSPQPAVEMLRVWSHMPLDPGVAMLLVSLTMTAMATCMYLNACLVAQPFKYALYHDARAL